MSDNDEYPKYVPRKVTFRYKCDGCLRDVVRYFHSAYEDDFDKFVNIKLNEKISISCPNCKKSTEITIEKINNEYYDEDG
jgi:ribosomal protein L44E